MKTITEVWIWEEPNRKNKKINLFALLEMKIRFGALS